MGHYDMTKVLEEMTMIVAHFLVPPLQNYVQIKKVLV